jgi:hypothetical protein
VAGLGSKLGIICPDQLARLSELLLALQQLAAEIGDWRQAVMLAPQLGEPGWGGGCVGGRQ